MFPGSEPETIARLAADNGFGHVTFQYDYVAQRPLLGGARDACHSFGLTFGVWCASPALAVEAANAAGPDHVVLQAEAAQDWATIARGLRAAHPTLPAAVVTTGMDKASADALVAANFRCLTECYEVDNPQATIANQNFELTKLGWPRTQPVLGCYHGYPASSYVTEGLAAWPGYWVWLAETMTGQDWIALRSFNLDG